MSYDIFARFYDALTENINYRERALFISALLEKNKPGCSLVVDLACGTGSLSVELSALGYDMLGVDACADMLTVARQKNDSNKIMYLCQRMQELDLYGTVDGVVCALDSVNHVTDATELAQAFKRVALFLEPDGVFIFDANTIYKHENILGDNTFVYDLDDIYCVWQNRNNGDGRTTISLDFFERRREVYIRSAEEFSERAYSREKLYQMLGDSGMYVAEEYDDYTSAPPVPESQRVVYVCRKK